MTIEAGRARIVDLLPVVDLDPGGAWLVAQELLRPDGDIPPDLSRQALRELLADVTVAVVASGWSPADLVQVLARRRPPGCRPVLVGLLHAETARHPADRVSPLWRAELVGAGAAAALDVQRLSGLQTALALASCLSLLPPIAVLVPPPGSRPPAGQHGGLTPSPDDARLLAKVRALLAKAESTEFDDEAEALSAKAQELITRYALEQLLAQADTAPAASPVTARRIWLDQPYVIAKATLVDVVATANGCRSVASDKLGFSTVIGPEAALAAVDVLVTSLLVQAGAAVRRCGSQSDRTGTSRTRSFRRSFLIAYASRIGERLRCATEEAVRDTGRSGDLVPVLRRQDEQVASATQAMFPRLVSRSTTVGNAQGWAAGRSAADLASLHGRSPLPG